MKKKFDKAFIITLIFIILSICFIYFDLFTIIFEITSKKIFSFDFSLISEYNFSLEKILCINYNPVNHIFLIFICIILFILHLCILTLIIKTDKLSSLEFKSYSN